MRIAFVHHQKAFLPGIKAYTNYLSALGYECISVPKKELSGVQADIHWHFMGLHTGKRIPGVLLIHEYASASVPPFNTIKDTIKRIINIQPDVRVFLNRAVQKKFSFNDPVPFCYRDVGVYPALVHYQPEIEKKYDFIQTGAVTADMQFEKLLREFTTGKMKEHNFLILGRTDEKLLRKFSGYTNIVFHPPVEQQEVPRYLSQARFAINFKPDTAPYNFQSSTKLLEYLNFKIPVISSNNQWIRDFKKNSGAGFYLLENDLSNFTMKEITEYEYIFPDMEPYYWNKQIEQSGLIEIIENFRKKKG